jgi:hypothetical protein
MTKAPAVFASQSSDERRHSRGPYGETRNCGSHYIEAVWGGGYVLRDPAPRSGNVAQNAGRNDAAARHGVGAH